MVRKKDNIKVMLNGEFFVLSGDLKGALSSVLSVWYSKINYFSAENMRDKIEGAISLVEELMDTKSEARTKRQITNIRKYLERDLTREQLIKFYTDIIMAGEGLSTLSGFGIAKTSTTAGKRSGKAAAGLNAEKLSLYEMK
ncbi:MAG TPA: hypothetical protein P5293_06910 [Bacteroidales bacterium]|nr:hypothetical protein [Bacteroidales bacterium]